MTTATTGSVNGTAPDSPGGPDPLPSAVSPVPQTEGQSAIGRSVTPTIAQDHVGANAAPAKRTRRKRTQKSPASEAPATSDAEGVNAPETAAGKRARRTPLFPASTFEDALELAAAIYRFGSGQPVRRVSLFDNLDKSPDSGPTRQLITNSSRYGLTIGSYKAETLELTTDGLQAVGDDTTPSARVRARFKCAVENVEVFKKLFDSYVGSRLPAQAALMDYARSAGVPEEGLAECIETFTVNTKFVGVLRSISGAERLIDVDTLVGDYLPTDNRAVNDKKQAAGALNPRSVGPITSAAVSGYDTACFYITPIGDEGSDARKHADLFMGSLIEPALAEFGLNLVRADKIGEAGMITGQIIEHLIYSKLVIVDLSFHNPNVFYELALRHAVRKPIVQICRAADRLPFDVGQVRTIVVDTTDLYSFVP